MTPRVVPTLVRSPKHAGLRAVCGVGFFGYPYFSTSSLPDRVYAGLDSASRPTSFALIEPEADLTVVPTPLEHLVSGIDGIGVAESRAALARLEAFWLLAEDRYRLLDASDVEPLAHQASLVDHVLATPDLRRVLIADEVGLGKTIEVGLLVRRLIEARPDARPRVLYLTEARLVDNVVDELRRLGLDPRRWAVDCAEARLEPDHSDPFVVASIHRAVYQSDTGANHFETVARSGPWDVIVVDEAHHLTDYSGDGSDPAQRMRLVRRLVERRLNPDGRLVLLTGTPHQGHEGRFRSILLLLSDDGANVQQASGRVVYRTKEDVRDWSGMPLFPARRVNTPIAVDVSAGYRAWLSEIHRVLAPRGASRAEGWRRAQALQWAASSPEAGLGFLARMALRGGLTSRAPALRAAIEALRPYRGGSADEPVASLEQRLASAAGDSVDGGLSVAHTPEFARVLEAGAALVRDDAFGDKLRHLDTLLGAAPDEKFVVFAQPVDTVHLLRRRLSRAHGEGAVAMVVGAQDHPTRAKEIARFREDRRTRVLVSSRAGGEGINLQVSRRLVHFDVPWNPMEMEQRVGRIHRYGSVGTAIVDTLVLDGSREQRVLDRCRARLGVIARDLRGSGPDFEALFARTMALVPLEALEALMAGEQFGPLSPAEGERLDVLVRAGFDLWRTTDERFRERTHRVRQLERGHAREADLEAFLTHVLGARTEPGWKRRALAISPSGDEPAVVESDARVLRLPDGTLGYVGLQESVGWSPPGGAAERPRRLGLNDAWVIEAVRALFDRTPGRTEGAAGAGAALVAVPAESWSSLARDVPLFRASPGGAIVVAYGVRAIDATGSGARETRTWMACAALTPDGTRSEPLDATSTAAVVRVVSRGTPRRARAVALDAARLRALEASIIASQRETQPGAPVHAVFPLAALWVEPASATREGD